MQVPSFLHTSGPSEDLKICKGQTHFYTSNPLKEKVFLILDAIFLEGGRGSVASKPTGSEGSVHCSE